MSENIYNKHYVRLDLKSQIIKGFSDAFEQPQDGDILINKQGSYQFRLFPNGEENPQLINESGVLLYKYADDKVQKRTQEEIETDTTKLEQFPMPINLAEQNRADILYLSIMTGVDL